MTRWTLGRVDVELTTGDITAQTDVDVVVNAANAQLAPGGGVAGAIHAAAGPGLAEECADLAPIAPGTCVLTGGHQLPNAHVIHCLGPVYGQDDPAEELLASCYREALSLAERNQLGSIAFPAISTGAFGFPTRQAAEVALRTVAETAPGLRTVTRIRLVLFDQEALAVHEEVRARLAADGLHGPQGPAPRQS